MKRILHLISSPRTDASVSRKLGRAVMDRLLLKYPSNEVRELDLAAQDIPHLATHHLDAFFTPADQRTAAQQAAIATSDAAVAAVQWADILVVEAPMYNFTIPSTLKAFFDHLARAGVTFRYTGNGLLPEGLLKDKQAYIVTSSGGLYAAGELKQYDFLEPYVRFFLTLIGITVVDVFRAEGQAIVGPEVAYQRALESIDV